jgi:hypothetical protein
MNTSIYCFYPATYGQDVDGNALLYNVYNGASWLGETQVPLTNTSGTPGSVTFDDQIWCFHQGNVNNGQLWYNRSYDGVNWIGDLKLESSLLTSGVSACVYLDHLYCFYTGGDDAYGNKLLYNVFNGEVWSGEMTVPLTNSSQAPSVVMYMGKLYCFHEGNLNNGELWYNVFDGTNWLGDKQISASPLSSGPSACFYEGEIYCFYPGTYGVDVDGNALLYNVFDGTNWSGESQVPSTNISKNPSAVVLNNKIYCFHQGNLANGELWYNIFDGQNWLGDIHLASSELSWGPGATKDLRNEIRRRLETTTVVANPALPDPTVEGFFNCPSDSRYNWDNKPADSQFFGLTGIINWRECDSIQGTLNTGNIFIFPGIRMPKDKAEKLGHEYTGTAEINGQITSPLYLDNNSTLHTKLCQELMPSEYSGGIIEYKTNFVGFSYRPYKNEQCSQMSYNSNSLNLEWFERVNEAGETYKSRRLSKDWRDSLNTACDEFFQ